MPSTMAVNRPVTVEPSKSDLSKRKGTRSLSTRTPTQRARKRANDREYQRAIRAHTKEHIEHLERELEKQQNRDRTLQDLRCRNKALEDELSRLYESMGMYMASSSYSAIAPSDKQYEAPGPKSSPRASPLATSADYKLLPDYSKHYIPMPGSSVAANVLTHIGSSVSSPSSSTDDSVASYIPTSVPISIMYTSNGLKSLDNFRLNNMQMQLNVYTHQQQQHRHHPPEQGSFHSTWLTYPVYHSSQVNGKEAISSNSSQHKLSN